MCTNGSQRGWEAQRISANVTRNSQKWAQSQSKNYWTFWTIHSKNLQRCWMGSTRSHYWTHVKFKPKKPKTESAKIRFGEPFPSPTGGTTVDIELLSMSLVSTQPVSLDKLQGTANFAGIYPGARR